MTIIIVFTFFFCWTPYVVIDLWYLFDPTSAEALDPRIQTSLFMFAVSNSCVNPLVYGSYIFNFSAFLRGLFKCRVTSKAPLSRQASAVTRCTQVDRMHVNGFLPSVVEGQISRFQPAESVPSTESYLELKHASPLRRPITRKKRDDLEESPLYSGQSLSSPSQSCSNRCSEEGNAIFD